MKIGRLEPEIWVDKEIASKWKIYISKLKPVKGIERLMKISILLYFPYKTLGEVKNPSFVQEISS
jgi:hypothetical protein